MAKRKGGTLFRHAKGSPRIGREESAGSGTKMRSSHALTHRGRRKGRR